MTDPISIMIVDDHPMVREGLAAMLESEHDFTVTALAASGEEAVAIGELGPGMTLVDGTHDPAFTGPLLRLVTAGGTATGPGMGATGRAADAPPPIGTGYLARVLSGEQSNTSIVYRTDAVSSPGKP